MKQIFQFDHKTVTYHGNGQYTVTADHGFVLREQGTNSLTATANACDNSRYEVIADEQIKQQKPASETEEEQPQPTQTKKSKKTSAGK